MRRSTIIALSSGALPSGIAVVRISGPQTRTALRLSAGGVPEARRLVLRRLRDEHAEVLDTGLVVFFPAPRSYTGEDSAELHLHGSRAVVAAMLRFLCRIDGVVLAEPGEFTRRAFEAGRLDLTQVEGLGDLVAAETEAQRRAALARSNGDLARRIAGWRERIVELRAEVEARLDFSDEGDVREALPSGFDEAISDLESGLASAARGYEAGRIARDGFRVVLAGAPNAGKSSLLNALAGSDEAIVSPEAGTTRDVKEVRLDLGGQLIRLFDVAGLRRSESLAESEGVRRAEEAIRSADLVLWLEAPDVATLPPPECAAELLRLGAKCDLGIMTDVGISVSARTGQGIGALKQRITDQAAAGVAGEPALISHLRDKESIEKACAFLAKARSSGFAEEILAEHLRLAGVALARLTGEIDAEDVLDRMFSGFCIGK